MVLSSGGRNWTGDFRRRSIAAKFDLNVNSMCFLSYSKHTPPMVIAFIKGSVHKDKYFISVQWWCTKL